MAGKRFTRGVGRAARRETSWFDIPPTSVGIGATSVNLALSLTALELAKRPFTVVRTHLQIHLNTDQLIASELQFGAVGMCVVSDQAVAIGVTAVPTPITDLQSDLWFLHQILINEFTLGTAVGFDARAGYQYTIDSKAMRKVNDDQDVILVLEGSNVGSGMGMDLAGRLMIKES